MLNYPQKVNVFWRNNTRAWYESKGYKWTKQGELFEVDILDLHEGSTQVVTFTCDSVNCNNQFTLQWRFYKQRKKSISLSFCSNCKRRSGEDPQVMRLKIESEFDKYGHYLLNAKEYSNNNSRLLYICKIHKEKGVQFTTWRTFNRYKNACFFCKYEKISKANKGKIFSNNSLHKNSDFETVYENFRKLFEDREYILLPDQVIRNKKTKLNYICLKHKSSGIKKIRIDHFLNGTGCRECSTDAVRKQYNENDLIEIFNEANAKLVTNEPYKELKQSFKYICNIHPEIGVQHVRLDHLIDRNRIPCKACLKEIKSAVRGELHPGWKGGITKISAHFRNEIESWKRESIINGNNKCILTGGNNIVVHHLYPFHKILYEALEINSLEIRGQVGMYSKNELTKITNALIRLHNIYGLGVCLDKEIHVLFHRIYGFETNSKDFDDFMQRFNKGEFN
ncbi:hypothetical protein M9R32_11030 [Paenisporosarcina quisquiliarum]|uniref:Uncharacterized protein n=1 Tax=Paenisporosarcina quisquiliarum TaxID=365346 RepID=A0A9X3LGY7_9BACL|nr:hypothetical protein [Paenisporosarcina quisquiliarum]MCZ8537716.1 hypothetical protein [Paenisporosarcina quisquiliarum]